MCVPRSIFIHYDDYKVRIYVEDSCPDNLCIYVDYDGTMDENDLDGIKRVIENIRKNKELIKKLFDDLYVCER